MPGTATIGWIINSGTDPDVQAFYDATGLTDVTQKSAINQLVLDLKAANIWTKMFAIYPFVGGTEAFHKWNLKDPQDTDAAYRLTFTGSWVHSANGALPDAIATVIDTHFVCSGNFTTSSAAFGYYSRTVTTGDNMAEIDRLDGSSNRILLAMRWGNDNGFYDCYTNGVERITVAVGTSTRLHIGSRTSTTLFTAYRDAVSLGTYTTLVAGSLPTGTVKLAAIDNNGAISLHSNRECAFAFFSQGLDSSEVTALNTAVTNYQTTLGRAV